MARIWREVVLPQAAMGIRGVHVRNRHRDASPPLAPALWIMNLRLYGLRELRDRIHTVDEFEPRDRSTVP